MCYSLMSPASHRFAYTHKHDRSCNNTNNNNECTNNERESIIQSEKKQQTETHALRARYFNASLLQIALERGNDRFKSEYVCLPWPRACTCVVSMCGSAAALLMFVLLLLPRSQQLTEYSIHQSSLSTHIANYFVCESATQKNHTENVNAIQPQFNCQATTTIKVGNDGCGSAFFTFNLI